MTALRRHAALLLGVVAITVSMAGFWVLSRAGYPGGPDECLALDECYCEGVGPGIAAQPANSWSNAGFALAGLLVLADVARRRRGRSRMSTDDRYPSLFGAVAVFLGLGSFAFHGSMRAWGGYVDVLSMHAFIAFVIAYDLARIHDWAWVRFISWYTGLLAVFAAAIAALPPEHGKTLFAALVAVALLVEAAVSYPRLRPWSTLVLTPHRIPWFWTGLGVFAAANVIWNLSRTGAVWCHPESLLQGHAAWHLLSAVSVGCFYLYFRGEGRAGRPPERHSPAPASSAASA